MRMKRASLVTAGVAAAGLILAGGAVVASAQDSAAGKKPAIGEGETKRKDSAEKKLDSAEQQRLRADLDSLLKQRADLDRRIAETRGKLGGTGTRSHRFEFRNGDGPPQVFEFNGDGANLPPEARKQLEEAQKRMQEAFGHMQFNNLPGFDFKFDGAVGPDGFPDMKAFRDSMQKWREEMRDWKQRRQNGAPNDKKNEKHNEKQNDKATGSKLKTFDS